MRPLDRLREDAVGGGRRDRVGRVVQVERGRLRRGCVPVRPPVREQRQRDARGRDERDGRAVVRIAGIREDDRAAPLDRHLRELDQAGLRARQHRDLAGRVELDAVDVAIARCDRLLQRREPRERRVAVRLRAGRRPRQRLDDVRRRRHVGIAAAEVDERLAALAGRRRHAREQPREVLLGQPLEPVRTRLHGAGDYAADGWAVATRRAAARPATGRRRPRRSASPAHGRASTPRARNQSQTRSDELAPAPTRPT